MRDRFFKSNLIVLGVLAGLAALPAQAGGNDAVRSVDNFQVVSKALWRGAAPSEKGMHELARGGVKTVVDLRMSRGASAKESALAGRLGINYVHLPMGYLTPSVEKVNQFLRIVMNPQNQPVYVHCAQGADRTGTLVGIYRMLVQGWSFDRVYEEMRGHHFKPWLLGLKHTVAQWEPAAGQPGASKVAEHSEPSL